MNLSSLSALSAACLMPLACMVASAQDPAVQPAAELVKRVTPEWADKVVFQIDNTLKSPVISSANQQIHIAAPNVLECIRGYGYYLRKIALVHLSWNGDNYNPAKIIFPKNSVTVPETLPFNYALNYCTLSYSCAHWDKKKWEKEIDRFALNGFKYMLVTSGLELVWQHFLADLDYPADKIQKFIPAPAYAAWWNMGNLEGEGGPLPQSLIDSEAELGRFIVKRMQSLGMEPVLQGYVGFLPHDFPKEGVDGTIIPQGKWCGYNRPAVLQPTAPAFPEYAKLWYKHLHQVYGTTAKAYGGDLFHEGGKKGNTPLTEAAQAVQKAMLDASPQSIWLIQAWGGNPDGRLLQGTDPKHTVILALNKNMASQQKLQKNYQGRPYVWCELANFGGKHGMYGGFELLEKMPGDAAGAAGIGLLSEGVETNPLYYALLYERMNNRGEINRNDFLKEYSLARYGKTDPDIVKALDLLAKSVYHPNKQREGCVENIACARPSLTAVKASTWSAAEVYYNPQDLVEAGKLMLKFAKKHKLENSATLCYDIVDVCRQILSDRMRAQLPSCKKAFDEKKKAAFIKQKNKFLGYIRQSALLLNTSNDFILGRYMQGALNRGTTEKDKKLLQRSMLQLFSTWRPDIGLLNDYSHRQFAEMMGQYYLKRWSVFFDTQISVLEGKAEAAGESEKQYTTNNGEKTAYTKNKNASVDAIELAFPDSKIKMRQKAKTGSTVRIAEIILNEKI